MSGDPDLIARGRTLAERLQQESRKHSTWDASMKKLSDEASMEGEPLALDDLDARAARQLVEDATTVSRLVDALEAGSGPPATSGAADADTVAGEAYQVVGALADAAGLFDHPEVQRALDYFSSSEPDGSLLPFIIPRPAP